jgi:hypothetical protein
MQNTKEEQIDESGMTKPKKEVEVEVMPEKEVEVKPKLNKK